MFLTWMLAGLILFGSYNIYQINHSSNSLKNQKEKKYKETIAFSKEVEEKLKKYLYDENHEYEVFIDKFIENHYLTKKLKQIIDKYEKASHSKYLGTSTFSYDNWFKLNEATYQSLLGINKTIETLKNKPKFFEYEPLDDQKVIDRELKAIKQKKLIKNMYYIKQDLEKLSFALKNIKNPVLKDKMKKEGIKRMKIEYGEYWDYYLDHNFALEWLF